jgi:hypothetical protein
VSPTREGLLQAALRYADAGWPVFRCKPGAKVPLDGSAGFKDATSVRQIIEDWWRSLPYNVAIPTGIITADVLDIDVKPEGSGWAALNQVKRAGMLAGAWAMVRTRSGGLHIYFAGSDQPCGRLPLHHLDFKATGGYVLVPPSFVEADDKGPAGTYELIDHRAGDGTRLDWRAVRGLLDPPRPRRFRSSAPGGSAERLARWVERQATPGDRHGPVHWAARRALEGGLLDEVVAERLVAASVSASHDERDARTTVRSILREVEG